MVRPFIGDVDLNEAFDEAAFHAKQEEINARSEKWAVDRTGRMLELISTLGIVDTGNLFRRLRYRLRLDYGEVDRISWGLPRYGIMVEKGVGKGNPIESVSGNGASLGQRSPRKWFSTPLDEDAGTKELADLLADLNADKMVHAVGIGRKRL